MSSLRKQAKQKPSTVQELLADLRHQHESVKRERIAVNKKLTLMDIERNQLRLRSVALKNKEELLRAEIYATTHTGNKK